MSPRKPIEHVFISNDPIEVGRMTDAHKYKPFSALCVALSGIDRDTPQWESYFRQGLVKWRGGLSVKEHWHFFVKPACERCELLQLMLRANVKPAARGTFDRAQLQALMQQIESESHP